MIPNLKRTISLLVALCYFTTQVALASVAESNIWVERRKKSSVVSNQSSDNQLFASLPVQLLPISATLPTLPKWSDTNLSKGLKMSPSLKQVVDAVPLLYGTVQDIHDSSDDKTPPVVLVQDVHMNNEAQTNIALLLQELINQNKVGVVGVEGAFSEFDFKPFREFPDKKITKEVTEAFLNKNLLAAPSYVGITSSQVPPLFVGVDDRAHYDANVQAYLGSRSVKERVKQELARIEAALIESKKKTFSPALLQFDGYHAAHAKGDIGLGTYVKKLYVIASEAKQSSMPLAKGEIASSLNNAPRNDNPDSFVLDQFLEAYNLETQLDFKRVESERKFVIEKLTKALNEKEISILLAQSLAYRMGKMSFGAYYQNLKTLCAEKGVSLSQTPAFDDYIRYVLLSDGIKASKLFESVKALEENVLNKLAVTAEEKKLTLESEQLALTKKLVGFSLTPEEWKRYWFFKYGFLPPTGGGQEGGSLPFNRSNPVSATAGSPTPAPSPNGEGNHQGRLVLTPFEQFYEQADLRSQKMVENIFKPIINPQAPNLNKSIESLKLDDWKLSHPTVLIAGGFHTPEIAQILREKKISYVVVSPKITQIDTSKGSEYLSVFAREKTPIEKLLAGEKLFLALESTNVAYPPARWSLIRTMIGRLPPTERIKEYSRLLRNWLHSIRAEPRTNHFTEETKQKSEESAAPLFKHVEPLEIENLPEKYDRTKFLKFQIRLARAIDSEILKHSDEEIVASVNSMSGRNLKVSDFTGDVYIGFYAEGTHKQVFKMSFGLVNNQEFELLVAVKNEKERGDITDQELDDLILLSGETEHTPRFGRYIDYTDSEGRLRFYVEEFIPGSTARELLRAGQLNEARRRKIVEALLKIGNKLDTIPKDCHAGNFVLSPVGNTERAVMVDIGSRRTPLEQSLFRIIGFYGNFGTERRSNRFIYGSYLKVFGWKGLDILRSNLRYIQDQKAWDQSKNKTTGDTSTKKKVKREERNEPALTVDDQKRIVRELDQFIKEQTPTLASIRDQQAKKKRSPALGGRMEWLRRIAVWSGISAAWFDRNVYWIENTLTIGVGILFAAGLGVDFTRVPDVTTLIAVNNLIWLMFFAGHVVDWILYFLGRQQRPPPMNLLFAGIISGVGVVLGYLPFTDAAFQMALILIVPIAAHWGINAKIFFPNRNSKIIAAVFILLAFVGVANSYDTLYAPILYGKQYAVVLLNIVFLPLGLFFMAFPLLIFSFNIANIFYPFKRLLENSQYYVVQPKKPLETSQWPSVTIQIPVYKENFSDVIEPTLEHAIKATKNRANIVVYDDGLMVLARDDLPGAERLIAEKHARGEALNQDETEIEKRLNFYRTHSIGFVARSKDNRRGLFKKASNLNVGMELSDAIELELQNGNLPITKDRYEVALRKILAQQQAPLVVEGNILVGDFIVLLDKDSIIPQDVIAVTLPEFLSDDRLAFTQHRTHPTNSSENYFSSMVGLFTENLYNLFFSVGAHGGDVPPFVGHNAFLRKSAMKEVRKQEADGKLKYWTEDRVSEDFELSLKLQAAGYFGRFVSFPGLDFGEAVTRTYEEETKKFNKFAFGAMELVFNRLHEMSAKGIFTNTFVSYLRSLTVPWNSKVDLVLYLSSYFAISSIVLGLPIQIGLLALGVQWGQTAVSTLWITGINVFIFGIFSTLINTWNRKRIANLQGLGLTQGSEQRTLWNQVTLGFVFFLFVTGLSWSYFTGTTYHFLGLRPTFGATNMDRLEDAPLLEVTKQIVKSHLTQLLLSLGVLAFIAWSFFFWHIYPFWHIFTVPLILAIGHFTGPFVFNPLFMRKIFPGLISSDRKDPPRGASAPNQDADAPKVGVQNATRDELRLWLDLLERQDVADINKELERAFAANNQVIEALQKINMNSPDYKEQVLSAWEISANHVITDRNTNLINEEIGKYRITRKIAQSGFGVVYEAVDENTKQKVAIKVSNVDGRKLSGFYLILFTGALHLEASTLRTITNGSKQPLFPRYIDDRFDPTIKTNYLVMDFLPGENMADLFERDGLTLNDVIKMLQALKQIHDAGYVHRDVKPANFIKDNNGVVRIVDFGTAAPENLHAEAVWPTDNMGTPEFRTFTHDISQHSKPIDLYSIGVILGQMIENWPQEINNLESSQVKRKLDTIERRLEQPVANTPPTVDQVIAELNELVQSHRTMANRRIRNRPSNAVDSLATQFIDVITRDLKKKKSNLEVRSDVLHLLMSRERLSSLRAGQETATSKDTSLIPSNLLDELARKLRERVDSGEITPAQSEEAATILAAVLALSYSQTEISDSLLSIGTFAPTDNLNGRVYTAEWLPLDPEAAAQRIEELDRNRLEAGFTFDVNHNQHFLVIDHALLKNERIKALKKNLKTIILVDAQNLTSAKLVQQMHGGKSDESAWNGVTHQFLLRPEIPLPADFFKDCDEKLRATFEVILLLNATQAIRIAPALFNSFETARRTLIQA